MKLLIYLAMFSLVACASNSKTAGRNPSSTEELCDTVENCEILRAKINTRIYELKTTPAPKFTDIAKSKDGRVLFMTVDQGEKYCESIHGRLPSAFEYAQFAAANNPTDVLTKEYIRDSFGNRYGLAREFVEDYVDHNAGKVPDASLMAQGVYWYLISSGPMAAEESEKFRSYVNDHFGRVPSNVVKEWGSFVVNDRRPIYPWSPPLHKNFYGVLIHRIDQVQNLLDPPSPVIRFKRTCRDILWNNY